MESAVLMKNTEQQLSGDESVQADAALDKGTQADIALHDDEGSGLVLRKPFDGHQDFGGRFGPPETGAEPSLAANARQRPADLGLEKYDHRERRIGDDEIEQGMQGFQARPHRHQVGQHQHKDPYQHMPRPRAAHDHEELINYEPHHENIDHAGYGEAWPGQMNLGDGRRHQAENSS